MATRSNIGVIENGMARIIYCHWDGYLSNNGKILKENYNDINKINELLSLGDISSLDTTVENTIAYARDRGEDINHNSIVKIEDANEEEYLYLYDIDNNKWMYEAHHGGLKELTDDAILKD